MPCLFLVHSGPYRGKVFPVEATRPLLIGRALEADFTIPDGQIEAFHCRVEFASGQSGRMAKVIALNAESEKQLEVDGVPFDEALLQSGERVKIGETTIEFREGGAADDPVAGRRARPEDPCYSCGLLVPRQGGGRVLLGDSYCCRCVDLRLTVKRELGRYRIIRKIGRDVAEIVYLAEDLRSEPPEKAALHVLKSERQHDARVLRRFLTKAVFAKDLDHPLFPLSRDLTNKPEVCSYTEEYLEWPSLAERLERKPLATYVAAKAAMQVADGLRYARRRGIIVGKLRAPRVYVADSGAVRIRDYWLTPEVEEAMAVRVGAPAAVPLPEAPGDEDLSMGVAGGGEDVAISADMRRYLAPDPKEAAAARDEASDIRAVAILFSQLAAGAMPAEASPYEVIERVKRGYLVGKRPNASAEPPQLLARVITRAFETLSTPRSASRAAGSATPNIPPARYSTLLELHKDLKSLVPLL